MQTNLKTYFRKAAVFSLFCIYLVIIAGAVVRMTGSGMGCPDWPKCFGYMIPPTEISQIQWSPNSHFEKGRIIILQEALYIAANDFTSSDSYNALNWEPYTKHNYAKFNVTHTWIEYINRLAGAFSGLPILIMTILSFWLFRENKWLTFLSLLTVFGMGFQAWLGKTVVDSNLASFKITVHMVMALVIVAVLLLIIFKASHYTAPTRVKKQFFVVIIISIVLTLIQIILGTQVRHDVDEQVKMVGYDATYLWLNDPSWRFYTHRSFSFLVLATNLYLWVVNRKNTYKLQKLNWVIVLILLEVLTGILMYYFDFPFGSQPIHLVIASLLFGVQFYVLLEAIKAVRSTETL